MLGAALYKLLLTDGSEVAKDIQQNIYVNNRFLKCRYMYFHRLLYTGNSYLHSWAFNHNAINTIAQQDGTADNCTTANALGLFWTTDTDLLFLNPEESTSTQHTLITKSDILKDVSRLFDPLRFVKPITMLFKVFLQEL